MEQPGHQNQAPLPASSNGAVSPEAVPQAVANPPANTMNNPRIIMKPGFNGNHDVRMTDSTVAHDEEVAPHNGSHVNGGRIGENAVPVAPAAHEDGNPGDAEIWGSNLPSKSTYTVIRRANSPTPEIDRKFILAVANSGDSKGSERTRSHHVSIYLEAKGGDLSVLKQVEADIAKNVRGINRQTKDLSRTLNATPRYHDTLRKNEPWGAFDVIRAIVCGVLMLVCVGAGANTLAQTMVGSYVTGFENYTRNLLFSFLVVAFPIVIECFIHRTFSETGKRFMRALICLLAMLSFGFWVWSFAQTFSIAGSSAADLAAALFRSTGNDVGQKLNSLTIFQIITEVLVAAICALEVQYLFESHRLSDRATNPQFMKTQKDLAWWRQLQRQEEELLGHARGP